jgi:Putative peptidoglycan binding domain
MHPVHQFRRWQWTGFCILLCLLLRGFAAAQADTSTPPATPESVKPATTATKHTSTHSSTRKTKTKSKTSTKKSAKKHGQQAIDSARAREIQTALIREHYMQGEPSGTWDSATQAAMQRYQADQGWQSKTTPDARALIKLGLGPSHDHLLNPESAMTTAPPAPKSVAKPAPAQDGLPKN